MTDENDQRESCSCAATLLAVAFLAAVAITGVVIVYWPDIMSGIAFARFFLAPPQPVPPP